MEMPDRRVGRQRLVISDIDLLGPFNRKIGPSKTILSQSQTNISKNEIGDMTRALIPSVA